MSGTRRLNALARFWEGEPPGEPGRNPARTDFGEVPGVSEVEPSRAEPRPPGITQDRLNIALYLDRSQQATLTASQMQGVKSLKGLGIGEVAIGKTISKENFDKSMVPAGRMQTLEGGNAGLYGAVTGQIALQSDHMLSPEEVQARINRMYEIQKPGGFTNMSQAIEQDSQQSQLVMNGILTPEQSMGTLSAFSAVGPPGQAATTTNQFVRATLGNQVRAKGMQVNPELDTEKTYEYFKRLGDDKENDPLKIGKAMAADLAAQKKANASLSPDRYLQEHGFGNQHDRDAIMAFSGLQNTGKLEMIEAAQNAPLELGGVIDRRFNERVAGDAFFQNRKAETADALATMKAGAANEPYEIARRMANAELKKNGALYGKYEDRNNLSPLNEFFADTAAPRDPGSNSYTALRENARSNLEREARRLNLKIEDPTSVFDVDRDQKLARQIQGAGGDVTGSTTMQSLESGAKSFERRMKRVEDALVPKVPAPIQGKPNQPRLRP
jgi:hypothetical protein